MSSRVYRPLAALLLGLLLFGGLFAWFTKGLAAATLLEDLLLSTPAV